MSKVIKRLNGETISIKDLNMETFYSEEELEVAKQKGNEIIVYANKDAREIKEKAENDAKTLLEKTVKEADDLKEQAKKQGYEEGLEKARKEIDQEFDGVLGAINKVRSMVDTSLNEIVMDVEKQIINLVMEICKKIIGYEAKANKEVVVSVINKCLAKTKEKNHIIIKINPNDLKYVEEKKDYFYKKVRGLKHLDIEESESVIEGGCIVETSIGDVSGDIDEQLDKIKDAYISGA